jgi:hypothetical protein
MLTLTTVASLKSFAKVGAQELKNKGWRKLLENCTEWPGLGKIQLYFRLGG